MNKNTEESNGKQPIFDQEEPEVLIAFIKEEFLKTNPKVLEDAKAKEKEKEEEEKRKEIERNFIDLEAPPKKKETVPEEEQPVVKDVDKRKLEVSDELPELVQKNGKKIQKDGRRLIYCNDSLKLCPQACIGEKCFNQRRCKFTHDVEAYLKHKPEDLGDYCVQHNLLGKCPFGYSCRYLKGHTTVAPSIIEQKKEDYSKTFLNIIDNDDLRNLAESKIDLSFSKEIIDRMDDLKIHQMLNSRLLSKKDMQKKKETKLWVLYDPTSNPNLPFGDEEEAEEEDVLIESCFEPREKKLIDFRNKTYLAPMSTLGNLPFRRICKGYGVDITCAEMAVSADLIRGKRSEWIKLRRHKSENLFGIQLEGNNPETLLTCADIANQYLSMDFVDLNAGCPIDIHYGNGGGAGLFKTPGKLGRILRGLDEVLDCPVTVKFRTGFEVETPIAKNFIRQFQKWGCNMAAMHGRTVKQRYSSLANWGYIQEVNEELCKPPHPANRMAYFGIGDVLNYDEYYKRLEETQVDGVMIARGALVKPWIFEEIRDRKFMDVSAQERLDLVKNFCDYGLELWGTDTWGVNLTRRYLLEWLSFHCRYIPYPLLAQPPQKLYQKPQPYYGRSDLENLFISPNSSDWIKISEMYLGKVPDNFRFIPKYKASSYYVQELKRNEKA